MQGLSKVKFMVLILAMTAPVYASAAEEANSSTLNNKTTQNDPDGFYLVQDKVWGENGCVIDSGKKQINPGESNILKIKNGCTWGGIRYKIVKVSTKADMGYLGHSFRDGSFTIDITEPCTGSECNFYDLSPQQNRQK